jgi:CBS domain-containing protein
VQEDESLLDVSKKMTKNVLRHIVIVDKDNKILGIVTSRDLTQLMAG